MTGYLVRRFGQILFTLFLIISLAFFLIQAQPGDYTSAYTQNPDIPPEGFDRSPDEHRGILPISDE